MSCTPRNSFLLAILFTVIAVSTQQRIDCRKFVFAPICRGVAAKRSGVGLEESRLIHSLMPQRRLNDVDLMSEVPDPYVTPPSEELFDESEEMSKDQKSKQRNKKMLQTISRHAGQHQEGQSGLYRVYLPRLTSRSFPLSDYEY